jgi:hypothetical protein
MFKEQNREANAEMRTRQPQACAMQPKPAAAATEFRHCQQHCVAAKVAHPPGFASRP